VVAQSEFVAILLCEQVTIRAVKQQLLGVSFVDSVTGTVVGGMGTILRTTTGGE
jgi:hypothetical protein